MIYLLVLIGSAVGICALLALQSFFKRKSMQSFVRSVERRSASAKEKGMQHTNDVIPAHKKAARTMAIDIKTVRDLTTKAERYIKQGDMQQAELCLIEALKYKEKQEDVQAQLAKLYLLTQRAHKAEALYIDLLSYSQNPSYYANLGLSFYHQGKYQESCKAYEDSLSLDESSYDRFFAYAHPLFALQRYELAINALEKAEKRLYRNPQLLNMLAECYIQIGDRDKARETYRKLARLQPSNNDVREKMVQLT